MTYSPMRTKYKSITQPIISNGNNYEHGDLFDYNELRHRDVNKKGNIPENTVITQGR